MWVIRILTGAQAGQTIPLPPGKSVVGRSSKSEIVIPEHGVSKQHAEMLVLPDKVVVTDLGSSNGTYVNGVRIQSQTLLPTDKISLHNVMIDIQSVSHDTYSAHQRLQHQESDLPAHPPMTSPAASSAGMIFNQHRGEIPDYTANQYTSNQGFPRQESPQEDRDKTPKEKLLDYIDRVALPGVYKLAEVSDFRWVIGGFVLAYIVMVTALSTVPMIMVTKSSIELESQRRALTIARNLAKENEASLLQNLESAVSVQSAQLEEGVEKAMIVSHVDGHVIAPVNQMGRFPQKSFVHSARQKSKEVVKQLDSEKVGAGVPIAFYNPSTGTVQISAWAIVIYDMGTLAIDDGRTMSMFVQTLAMALIIGGILFFFMFKLIEHPIQNINEQIDHALKDGSQLVSTQFQFPALQDLCSNISSALSRVSSGGESVGHGTMSLQVDRDMEASNLLQIIPCPALAIQAGDKTVMAVNPIFESEIGVSLHDLKQQGIDAIPDQAFQLSLVDLVDRLQQQPEAMASNQLEFSGINCELLAQAIYGAGGKPSYFVITIQPVNDYNEEVA